MIILLPRPQRPICLLLPAGIAPSPTLFVTSLQFYSLFNGFMNNNTFHDAMSIAKKWEFFLLCRAKTILGEVYKTDSSKNEFMLERI